MAFDAQPPHLNRRYKELPLHTWGMLAVENGSSVMPNVTFLEWPVDAHARRQGVNLTVGVLLNTPFVGYDNVSCTAVLRYISE